MIVADPQTREPIEVRGFALLYGQPSGPLTDRDGLREMILPGAFDGADISACEFNSHHVSTLRLLGQLDIAPVATGVMFRLRGIAATPAAMRVVGAIAAGEMNQCSFKAPLLGGKFDHEGEQLWAVTRAPVLEDICAISTGAAYPDAGCWTSNQTNLTPRLKVLRMAWHLDADNDDGTLWRSAGPPTSIVAGDPCAEASANDNHQEGAA